MEKTAPQYKQKGFTLIELLVALTIVAILAVTVYVALNPAQRLKDAKDARRAADVDTILTAIHQYVVDSKGALPSSIAGLDAGPPSPVDKQIGESCAAISNTNCSITALECISTLDTELAKYLKTMPFDPGTLGSANNTGYAVERTTDGIITVKACYTDGAATIEVSR